MWWSENRVGMGWSEIHVFQVDGDGSTDVRA